MSPFAVKAIQLILSLSILIVLHELGHFIPAKIFKTRVEKFFLFFDVKFALFKKKIGDTVYGIGWLPLGGYVKISGMIDESMDKEQMAQPPQPWEFRTKPAWQRLIIMLGGVTVNIIVGMLIYVGIMFFHGEYITTNEDMPNGYAVAESFEEYGFRDGDQILAVNGKEFRDVSDINRELLLRDIRTVEVKHTDGSIETVNLPEDIGSVMFESDVIEPFIPLLEPVLDTIIADYPAYSAGFKDGDRVLKVNGTPIEYYHEFRSEVQKRKDSVNTIVVLRERDTISIDVTPNEKGQIGVDYDRSQIGRTHLTYGLGASFSRGIGYGYGILRDYVKQFKYVFTAKGATQIGGFGAIGNLFPPTWSWVAFWHTTALISIILAFMNVLPIPALDGGHVAFLLYEMVTGRKPGDKFLEYAQMIGFFLLIALVLFANGNDIYRWLFQ
jgi:regulator of sigma E protease